MYIPCQERIEIPESKGSACTYCMRPRGHSDDDGKGGHSITLTREDKEHVNTSLHDKTGS